MSKHSVQINHIKCHDTSESGHDEVYMIYQADAGLPGRYPTTIGDYKSMKGGDKWSPNNLVLNFDNECLLTLWDQDLKFVPNLATFLVNHDFRPHSPGKFKLTLDNPNGAKYELEFTVIK